MKLMPVNGKTLQRYIDKDVWHGHLYR